MTYISWLSDFVLYVEDYLNDAHHTLGWIIIHCDKTFDLKINVAYISWSSDFALYLEDYLMNEHHTLG